MSSQKLGVRLGTRIRDRREALGWSQAELAEAAGVTPNYVGVVERGEKLPTLDTLSAVAASLRVSMGELLAEETPDAWADVAVALVRAIPAEHRGLVMALLKAAAEVPARTRSRQRYRDTGNDPAALAVSERRRRPAR